MTPTFTNVRHLPEPAQVWLNDANEPQVVEIGEEQFAVPAGWALVLWANSGISMMRSADVATTFEPAAQKVTIDDFINTVTDLRNEDRTAARRLNEAEDLLRAAIGRIEALEAKG